MRLIDADELDDVVLVLIQKGWTITRNDYKRIDGILFEFPTIDPVKHGRWIYGEDETIEDGGWCSACHCDQPTFWVDKAWRYVETRYCPHCGAMMDEVD